MMLNNSIRSLCLVILAAFPVQLLAAECPPAFQKPTPEDIQQAKRIASDHGYMWRITKDGHTSYLYGTMHIGKLEWYLPGEKVKQALRDTDTMALELDMMDPEIVKRAQKGLQEMHSHKLAKPLARRVRKVAEALCVPYEKLAAQPPELQVAVLGFAEGQREGLTVAYAVDPLLAKFGHMMGKDVVSLETPESQYKALIMSTPKETAEFVSSSLDELENGKGRKIIKRLSQAWANSDYAVMDSYYEWCECLDSEIERKMNKRMQNERNPHMADKIDAMHRSGKKVFVAVGSLHMFGEVALPLLMKKRGYQVERIMLHSAKAEGTR